MIYYTLSSTSLEEWLKNVPMQEALESIEHPSYIDLDPVFNGSVDEDFDSWLGGVARNRFLQVYSDWIKFCNERREKVGASFSSLKYYIKKN